MLSVICGLFNDAVCSSLNDWMRVNNKLEECGRKQSWTNLKMLSQDLPGGGKLQRTPVKRVTVPSSKMHIRSITTSSYLLGLNAIMIFLLDNAEQLLTSLLTLRCTADL
jgi:hypothetical protein